MAQWALPFFDTVHRDVAAGLTEWIKRQQVDEADDRKACQEWVQLLGEGQWLRYCVPSGTDGQWGGALETLDSRALVVIRETLAF